MTPGLVVRLRPAGPWRVGPDTGARSRVDSVYHSDSVYAAVTAAMARLGTLAEWLEATARASQPAVSFSSCFPFLDEIDFIVPPRTIWPPQSPSLMGARVRWKSARFVPLTMVRALVAGGRPDENAWAMDGPSECLVPAGRLGPFRTAVRFSAAVDRMSGASERHSIACTEFRAGAGLWLVTAFKEEAARERWSEPVKAAFRLLADSGFGGERSRGWGRSEAPEFVAGTLPELILPQVAPASGAPVETVSIGNDAAPNGDIESSATPSASELESLAREPEDGNGADAPVFGSEADSAAQPDVPTEAPDGSTFLDSAAAPTCAASVTASSVGLLEMEAPVALLEEAPADEPKPEAQPQAIGIGDASAKPHWLLSLFTPSAGDAVDWARGNYRLVERAGRVDSSAGSGELKKTLRMVGEGSVIYSPSTPRGAAPDVAPGGFPHPVYRAGFAVSVPLPEVS
jgi:CRISPR type III-A-associated RAMP protein Csm4